MEFSKSAIGFNIPEVSVTQILTAAITSPRSITFTTNRRRFGIFYKLSGISELQNDAGSWIFDQDHVVIIPKGCTYTIYPRELGQTIMIEFISKHISTTPSWMSPSSPRSPG